MDVAQLIAVVTQLGLAAAAWRLANALKGRVENHETRITKLEGVDHEQRITRLESA